MNSRSEFPLKQVDAVLFGLLGFITLAAAAIFLALTADRYPGVFLFGLAKQGTVELIILVFLALFFLLLLFRSLKNWQRFPEKFARTFYEKKYLFLVLFLLGLIIAWAVATIPPTFFGRFAGYYQWLRPAGFALGLIALHGWILYLVRSGKYIELRQPAQVVRSRMFITTFIIAVLLFAFSYRTKFGLVADTPLWNVPGVPVSGTQMFLLVISFMLLLLCETYFARFRAFITSKTAVVILPLLIFLTAVLVWGFTPLQGDSLAVEPTPANLQPFPQRDARVHDMGALSILFGQGINFKEYTDKPLYMVILALFHLVTGYDYRLLQWVQIAFLALIPVLAYLLGKRLHSALFGVLLAALLILQQRNAVVLSRMISSVNVKILVTETFVLLGILFLTFLLYKWQDHNDRRIMLLAGGVVGALSLIRLNPLLFIPFIALLIFIYYWKRKKLLLSRLLLFLLGFGIVFTPWVLSGRDAQGQPYFLVKIRDIFENRIVPQVEVVEERSLALSENAQAFDFRVPTKMEDIGGAISFAPVQVEMSGFFNPSGLLEGFSAVKGADGLTQYLKLLANHFLHNIAASVIPLPDVLSTDGVRVLAQRDYWDDMKIWDGALSGGLVRFIIINLTLVSLGIARSWKKHAWRGLLPLGIFLVYNLAISISLTSGGRYIVPIIWVVFLYYVLGIVFLFESFLHLLHPQPEASPRAESVSKSQQNTPLLPVLIGLVVVAMVVPAANQLVPRLVSRSPVDRAKMLFDSLGPQRQADNKYFTGIALYPVYSTGEGKVVFDLYRGYKISEVVIDLLPEPGADMLMNTRLESGDPVLLEYAGDDRLLAVYLFRDGKLLRYWWLNTSLQP